MPLTCCNTHTHLALPYPTQPYPTQPDPTPASEAHLEHRRQLHFKRVCLVCFYSREHLRCRAVHLSLKHWNLGSLDMLLLILLGSDRIHPLLCGLTADATAAEQRRSPAGLFAASHAYSCEARKPYRNPVTHESAARGRLGH